MTQRVAAAGAADGIELVDEDDARAVAPCVLEELPDARGADAGVHLDEVGSAREEKRHLRFARDRPREQRLAGSRRPDEQHAFRDAPADRGEPPRLAQEIDQLLHFLFRFVHARDVGKGDVARFGAGFARFAFECRDTAGGDAVQREAQEADEGEPDHERAVVVRRLLRRVVHLDADASFRRLGRERRIRGHVVRRRDRAHGAPAGQLHRERVAVDDDFGDRAAIEIAQQIRKRHRRHVDGHARADDDGGGPEQDHERRGGGDGAAAEQLA